MGVKLAELQSLVVRLLQERQLLQSYTSNGAANGVTEGHLGVSPDQTRPDGEYICVLSCVM